MKDFKRYIDLMDKCSHCAYCEATCPVFLEDLIETHVARSRLELIRAALVDHTLPVTNRIKEVVDRCLLCTNCKQTCPANIPVDEIVITARRYLYDGKRMNIFKRYLLKQMMEKRGIKGTMAKLGNFAKTLGAKSLPPIPDIPFEEMYTGTLSPKSEKRGRVVYYVGCGTNTIYPDTGTAVIKVLLENGFEVVFPDGIVCCGLPALGEGDLKTARKMMRKNISILSEIEADAVITDCTSCGMTLKEKAAHVLEDGDPLKEKAEALSPKIREVTEYLAEKGLTKAPGPLPEKFTYHVPCHRGWEPELANAPRKLLSQIPKAELVEMEFPEKCCGAGGTFFIDYKDLSHRIQTRKKQDIEATGADTVITQCPSCRSFLQSAFSGNVKVVHPMTMIAKAYE